VRKLRRALLAASALALMPVAMAHALINDPRILASGSFSTGRIDLVSSAASALVSMKGMAPGDAVIAPIAVSNRGTSALRYGLSTTIAGDPGLVAGLKLTIKRGVAVCSAPGFAASGIELYDGPLSAGAFADRALEPSRSEELCVRVSLPHSAGNEVQGASADAAFTFDAEEIAAH